MANGYNGKILIVDLTSGSHEIREPDERWYRTYFGGSGIIAETLLREDLSGVDPLGPENVRVLAVGAEEVPKILHPYLDQVGAPPAHKEGIAWYAAIHRGLVAVPGTPQERIDFISEKTDKIAETQAYAEAMDKAGLPAYYRPRKEYQNFIRKEKEQMIGILEKLGYIKVESGKIVVKKR